MYNFVCCKLLLDRIFNHLNTILYYQSYMMTCMIYIWKLWPPYYGDLKFISPTIPLIDFLFLYLSLLCILAPWLVHGMGLVNLPGRLWSANFQIPKSEPSHCPGSAGEVSASNLYKLFVYNISTSLLKASEAQDVDGLV